MGFKFFFQCNCGNELEESDISLLVYEDDCEMDFKVKCPKCGKEKSVYLPQEVKRRIIDKFEQR